uniref:Uncharacterized protein n=1 Tax=Arundo donax TaxID=35708 RepID=A0A0A9C4H4_ARUDO
MVQATWDRVCNAGVVMPKRGV